MFDVIVVDFPDPTNFSIGKLYTNSLLRAARPATWRRAATRWCRPPRRWSRARASGPSRRTIESVGLTATPYHAHVPSFGEWGFIIASRRPYRACPSALPAGPALPRRANACPLLFEFPRDMARVPRRGEPAVEPGARAPPTSRNGARSPMPRTQRRVPGAPAAAAAPLAARQAADIEGGFTGIDVARGHAAARPASAVRRRAPDGHAAHAGR